MKSSPLITEPNDPIPPEGSKSSPWVRNGYAVVYVWPPELTVITWCNAAKSSPLTRTKVLNDWNNDKITKDNILKLDQSVLVSSNYIDKVINALSEGSKHNKIDCYNDIRQIIADANIDDFDELFKSLYERASEYLQNKEGTAAILINEHQYKANFRIDKEINTMSLIQNLINNK